MVSEKLIIMLQIPSVLIPLSLLLLRLIVAIIFFSSGKSHAKDPVGRGKSIGMSAATTSFLGIAEIVAAVSLAFGLVPEIGSLIIIVVMAGAIYKKTTVWQTGFYSENGIGWHYDLLLLIAALVILATGGGEWVIW